MRRENASLGPLLMLEMIILLRQARDKHRENTQKRTAFSGGRASDSDSARQYQGGGARDQALVAAALRRCDTYLFFSVNVLRTPTVICHDRLGTRVTRTTQIHLKKGDGFLWIQSRTCTTSRQRSHGMTTTRYENAVFGAI